MGTAGGSVVNYFQNLNGMETLLGRPIFFTEYCETVGTEGDIILGNWGEYLDGMMTGGMMNASSIHVRFMANQTAFKFWMENDGRPWWTSPLTLKKGSSLAPWVTLANRA